MTNEINGLDLLREPFPANQIGKLPKPYKSDSAKGNCKECGGYHGLPAMHLDFVGHAALTDRFLNADPTWTWEPMGVTQEGLPAFDKEGGLWIRLTICGITRPGYGDAQGKKGPNAVKEAIGDALRNAGMRFGAALELWHKGDLHDMAEQVQADEPVATSEQVQDFEHGLATVATLDELNKLGGDIAKASLSADARIALRALFAARVAELKAA
jgi:hypothetical protein